VSPAYGFAALALVKCSNEGGPGPRYNRKEDPGSFIFSMLVVYGYYLYLLPLFSEPDDWKDQCGPLPPSLKPTWAKPPLPLGVHTPPPAKMKAKPASAETTLRPLIRGRRPQIGLEEDVETILGFSACLYKVRELSWRPAQVDQHPLLHSAFLCHLRKIRPGRYNQDASMAGR
jgi:hypothetical protein